MASEVPTVDLDIQSGEDFVVQIAWTSSAGEPMSIVAPIVMDIVSDDGITIFSLATVEAEDEARYENITYNTDSGVIQLRIDAEDTAGFAPGVYNYDLFATYNDKVLSTIRRKRLIKGQVYVSGRITNV